VTTFTHAVVGATVNVPCGVPAIDWTFTVITDGPELALHVCVTTAICVAALFPQVS
jgi:hypothetical protein